MIDVMGNTASSCVCGGKDPRPQMAPQNIFLTLPVAEPSKPYSLTLCPEDVEEIFATYDADGNGELDESEALVMIQHLAEAIHQRARSYAHEKIEASGAPPAVRQAVSSELDKALSEIFSSLESGAYYKSEQGRAWEMVRELLYACDVDGNGQVEKHEFLERFDTHRWCTPTIANITS